jgi:hypothetical protein
LPVLGHAFAVYHLESHRALPTMAEEAVEEPVPTPS